MNCPACQRPLYNRRLKQCGYCGTAIPEELQFTAEEIAELDREAADMEVQRRLRGIEKKLDQANDKIDAVKRRTSL